MTTAQFDLPAADLRSVAMDRDQISQAVDDAGPASVLDPPSDTAAIILRRMAMVAWLSILLGLAMEGLSLAGRASIGSYPTLVQITTELTQGITWSFFVCAGVGLGATLSRASAALGGLIGLISAPIAMGLAKGSQKVMVSALGAAEKPVIVSLMTLGAMRALEYGLLGWMLARLAARQEQRMSRFVLAGALAGVVFGGSITLLTINLAAAKNIVMAPPQVIATTLNEVVFPIGCSLVVYFAILVGRHLKLVAADQSTVK
jgi:hypothetical protein